MVFNGCRWHLPLKKNSRILDLSDFAYLLICTRIDIQDRVRRLKKNPREDARLEVERLRDRLTHDFRVLQSFPQSHQTRVAQGGSSLDEHEIPTAYDDLDDDRSDSGSEVDTDEPGSGRTQSKDKVIPPERQSVVLPSTHMPNNPGLRRAELALRKKQAARYLAAVREAVAEKSIQYSHVMRVAPSKGVRTRSRTTIAKLNDRISWYCRVYGRARAAMVRLNAGDDVLSKFQILLKEDVKASTAMINPNTSGSSTLRLSWIWQTRPLSAAGGADTMRECACLKLITDVSWTDIDLALKVQRVHWLRARAQMKRWSEELTLLKYEMEWTTRYFLHHYKKWQDRATVPHPHMGPKAYAARQSAQWRQMACEVERVFSAVNTGYINLVM
jgi:hypothetical protein